MACVICGGNATVTLNPPRRTFARGPDPDDPSYSIIALLPEVHLCTQHDQAAHKKELSIGWCDDEQCRRYGEVGQTSPCGEQYAALKR
jgi:hypothetical protein